MALARCMLLLHARKHTRIYTHAHAFIHSRAHSHTVVTRTPLYVKLFVYCMSYYRYIPYKQSFCPYTGFIDWYSHSVTFPPPPPESRVVYVKTSKNFVELERQRAQTSYTFCCPLQQWFLKHASLLRFTYIARLVLISPMSKE
jgi:hypothetical protein